MCALVTIIGHARRIANVDGESRVYWVRGCDYRVQVDFPEIAETPPVIALMYHNRPGSWGDQLVCVPTMDNVITLRNIQLVEKRMVFDCQAHVLSLELRPPGLTQPGTRARDTPQLVTIIAYKGGELNESTLLAKSEPIEVVSKKTTANKRANRILGVVRTHEQSTDSDNDEDSGHSRSSAPRKRRAKDDEDLSSQLQSINKTVVEMQQQVQALSHTVLMLAYSTVPSSSSSVQTLGSQTEPSSATSTRLSHGSNTISPLSATFSRVESSTMQTHKDEDQAPPKEFEQFHRDDDVNEPTSFLVAPD